ncbi:MAG: YdeI/OmpD-associated family protein [Planctomycetes bacterium]|nr:YdeI/OmpD-associated family protein [Planctomycetota bacterium]
MPTLDPRVDAYIDNAPEFAKPILVELRKRVHAACPDVRETIKWRMPSFEHHGLLAGMAAFKAHLTFGFWKDAVLRSEKDHLDTLDRVGCMKGIADLPPKAAFLKALKRAMEINEEGIALPRKKATKRAQIAMHPDFARALGASKKARAVFEAFAPSCKREYLEWIAEAKKDDTRSRRIEQAIDWIAAGRKRNWKYENC